MSTKSGEFAGKKEDCDSSDDNASITSHMLVSTVRNTGYRQIIMKKESSTNFRGNRIIFHFTCGNKKEYTAKIKNFPTSSSVYISEGTTCHISSGNYIGVILYNDQYSSFSLRKNSINGIEKCNIEYIRVNQLAPHSVHIYLFEEGTTIKLTNTPPKKNVFGLFEVDLNTKYAKKSSKNFRIINSQNEPIIFTRKIESCVVELEATDAIDDLVLITLGCSLFLTRI